MHGLVICSYAWTRTRGPVSGISCMFLVSLQHVHILFLFLIAFGPLRRSCGGGISRQQKRCRRKPCKGRSWNTKYKICNPEVSHTKNLIIHRIYQIFMRSIDLVKIKRSIEKVCQDTRNNRSDSSKAPIQLYPRKQLPYQYNSIEATPPLERRNTVYRKQQREIELT